ncbi:MAG: hypothetical protein EOO29_11500 [Comamonadaceae bacterium]|nr:MAG: hypothetical protein EOO29_11500 [Comamonadaceae bacterium]
MSVTLQEHGFTYHAAQLQALRALMPAPQLLALPLSAPAVRMPAVDGTHDSARPVARTLEQCAGGQRSSTARIETKDAQAPMHIADRIVLLGSAAGGLALAGMHAAGWVR